MKCVRGCKQNSRPCRKSIRVQVDIRFCSKNSHKRETPQPCKNIDNLFTVYHPDKTDHGSGSVPDSASGEADLQLSGADADDGRGAIV